MYQDLLRKIAEEKPNYNQEEIQWLLDHLGDPSPEIRDDLVFTSFARGIQEELFTQEQFHFIAEGVSSDVGLDKEIDKVGLPTLERSFRALVYANLLYADANQQSVFYQGLQLEIRNVFSNQGLHYLSKEKDTTGFSSQYGWVHAFAPGFSSQYGWVHAFAHGADLLTEVVCHPDFPINRIHEVFDILGQLFKRMSIRFTDDEDWRLARVIYEPILQGKLEQEQVASWIKTVDFPIEEREDFSKFSNFRSCLVEVYVQLDQRNSLQDELKEAIQSFQY
ncbi:aquaporin Z [Streptococcus pneumoniae]|nr:aquaporin Z [Streptococcus pneumoniae]